MSESGQGEPHFKESENVARERLGRFRGEHLRILNKCTWGICASLSITCIIGMAIVILKLVFFKKSVLAMVTVFPPNAAAGDGDPRADFSLEDAGPRGNVANLFAALERNLTEQEASSTNLTEETNIEAADAEDPSPVTFRVYDLDDVAAGPLMPPSKQEVNTVPHHVRNELRRNPKFSPGDIDFLTPDRPGEILLINSNEIIGNEIPILHDKRESEKGWLRNRDPVHSRDDERERESEEESKTDKNESDRGEDNAVAGSQMERRPLMDLKWSTSGLLRVGRRARRSMRRTTTSVLRGGTLETLRGG